MKRHILFAIAGVVAVALTGCSSGAPADSAPSDRTASGASSAPPPESQGPSEEPAPDDTPGRDDERDTGLSGTDPLTCLHGAWHADNEFFTASIREFGDEVKSVDGTVIITFGADGKMMTEYQDWIITAKAEGAEVQLKRSGVDDGTYEVSEAGVTIRDTAVGSTLSMNVAGVDMKITPEPVSYIDAEYICSPDQAIISTADGTLQLNRP